jgi:hypothetical protein
MARTLTIPARARGTATSAHNSLGWAYVIVAFMVCTFVICQAFPEDVPRSTLSKDASPEPGPAQTVKARDLG